MNACTRCGRWHTEAEADLGRRLSCTEVKRYWSEMRRKHRHATGHAARITTNEDGEWVCLTCNHKLR